MQAMVIRGGWYNADPEQWQDSPSNNEPERFGKS